MLSCSWTEKRNKIGKKLTPEISNLQLIASPGTAPIGAGRSRLEQLLMEPSHICILRKSQPGKKKKKFTGVVSQNQL